MAETRREPTGVRTGAVVAVTAATLVAVAIAVAVLWTVYRSTIYPMPAQRRGVAFPAPQLDPAAAAHQRADAAAKERVLDGYGWVDRSAGVVQIPITEAMKIVAARGRAAFDPVPAIPPAPVPPGAP